MSCVVKAGETALVTRTRTTARNLGLIKPEVAARPLEDRSPLPPPWREVFVGQQSDEQLLA